jgi:hypothetical protein
MKNRIKYLTKLSIVSLICMTMLLGVNGLTLAESNPTITQEGTSVTGGTWAWGNNIAWPAWL